MMNQQLIQTPTDYTLCKWLAAFAEKHFGYDAEICDVGCGNGRLCTFLADQGYRKVTGVDSSPLARVSDDRISFHPTKFDEFARIHERRFDFVFCVDVLEHIQDDAEFVATLLKTIKPGGWLLLVTPAHQALYGSRDVLYGHFRRYEKQQMSLLIPPKFRQSMTIRYFGFGFFLKLAELLSSKGDAGDGQESTLEENTQRSLIHQPPAIYKVVHPLFKFTFPIFYIMDIATSHFDQGCEMFVTVRCADTQ